VYTVSIHANPEFAYPNFAGFADETGAGAGLGYNLNIPLPRDVDGQKYTRALNRALAAIEAERPDYLVVALGLDVAKGDPTGSWSLAGQDFYDNGKTIARTRLPTLVVQEGGYKNRVLGSNARQFFQGLWDGYYAEGS
jgi:acetoin utilization deacetylase AcuC-like enzyme